MSYTNKERNNATLLMANGKVDFNNVALYEKLETFKWISIGRVNGIINKINLTYSGKNLAGACLKI